MTGEITAASESRIEKGGDLIFKSSFDIIELQYDGIYN